MCDFRETERLTDRNAFELAQHVLTEALDLGSHRAGNVGRQEDVRKFVQRVVAVERVRCCHVEDRLDSASPKLADQRILIDDGAACGVDQRRTVPEQG